MIFLVVYIILPSTLQLSLIVQIEEDFFVNAQQEATVTAISTKTATDQPTKP